MHDVIVVGGGVAGLTAASELATAGLDVVVIEARDRIGGRTHTTTLGDVTVDLGAAWVHDPAHNPLTPYLESISVDARSDGMWGQGMKAFSSSGWLPTEQTSSLVAALYNFDPDMARHALGGADQLDEGISWYVTTQLNPATRTAPVAAFLNQIIGAGITGDHSADISLEGMAVYEGDESGHNSVIVGGYRALVYRLADGLDIRLSMPVSEVKHSTTGVTVVTSDDQAVDARWAVVTAPLGVLKAGGIGFSPALSDQHIHALSHLKTKTLEKVVFSFAERFWSEDIAQVALLDDPNGFVWAHDLSAHAGGPTLVALYNPAIAARRAEGDAAAEAFASLLSKMFGSMPDPQHVATTDWTSDPYTLGAYSFIPVGASADDMATLAEPAGSRVLLAGEHTFPSYYGTVQAAWLSGKRTAAAIIGPRT